MNDRNPFDLARAQECFICCRFRTRLVAFEIAIFLMFFSSLAPAAAEKLFGAPKGDMASLQARHSPQWLTRGIIYQITLRSFTPEGTLKAATRRLPDVANLGATIVYLCPIMLQDDDTRLEYWSPRQKASQTNNPRNPYRIKDYNRIDPEYGTEADLHEFIATAHNLGLRVMLDLVYTQTGPTCVLLKHPEFYVHDAAGKVKLTGYNWMILNFKSPQLRRYLLANMVHWVKDFNVDGFRCDSSDGVPLDFWEEARDRLDPLRPDLVMLAEADSRTADQIKAFDLNYSFIWHNAVNEVFVKSLPASLLRATWQKMRDERPRGARFIRYTENHDLVNDMPRAEARFSERGSAAMSVINFTLDGVPLLYNGQEVGDTSMQTIFTPWPIRWEAACLPKGKSRLAFYQELCKARRSEPALTAGGVVWLDNDQPDSVVSFLRQAGNEEILSVVNLSNRSLKVNVELNGADAGSYRPMLSSGAKTAAAVGALSFNLEGFGYLVGKK